MKWMTMAIAAVVTCALAGGCANKKDKMDASADALDVTSPQPVAHAPAPAPQPIIYDAPVTVAPATPAPTMMASNSSYTVKRGDTLWKIATVHYGDGKQWQRIASANPGVAPQALRVGQVLTIP